MIKTFIIRLEENQHSCRMAAECYDQALKFGIRPEYFKAINGNDSEYHYNQTGIKRLGKFKKGRPGVNGCFFSHYYLWKKCIEIQEPILILEHDGYFLRNIDISILDKFEDVLKLDRLNPFEDNYNQNIKNEKNLPLEVCDYHNPSNKTTKVNLGEYFRGAWSYIIKPHASKKIIDFINKNGHRPADQQINSSILRLQTTIPTIARLHPFYSINNNIDTKSLTKNLNKGNANEN